MINRLSTVIIFEQALVFIKSHDYEHVLNHLLMNGDSELNTP